VSLILRHTKKECEMMRKPAAVSAAAIQASHCGAKVATDSTEMMSVAAFQ